MQHATPRRPRANRSLLKRCDVQVMVVGDSGVGKTSLVRELVGETRQHGPANVKQLLFNHKAYKLHVRDDVGQESFYSSTNPYRDVDMVLVVFDLAQQIVRATK